MKRDLENKKTDRVVEPGSGNVFTDLALSGAEEKYTKVRLAVAINAILRQSGLRQAGAAVRLGVNQPKISALANYRLEGFSVERLMAFLNALDRDVDIVIRPKPRSRKVARVNVSAAAFPSPNPSPRVV